jgi:hypothetical protein
MDPNNIAMIIPAPQAPTPCGTDAGETFNGFFEEPVAPDHETDIPALLQRIEKRILRARPGDFAFVYTDSPSRYFIFGIKNLEDFIRDNGPINQTVARAYNAGLKEAQQDIGQAAIFAGGVVRLGDWLHRVRPTAGGVIDVGRPFR